MLRDKQNAEQIADNINNELSDHALTKSHARHLSFKKCEEIGLKVLPLEENQKLQEAVLAVHHACIHTLTATDACKIIENHNGIAFIQQLKAIQVIKN
jgi:hypothetical protein